jgi:murein L,D-transpeptidase YcbB/YkuD
VLRHTAIVGKIDRQTPILNSKIHEIILNPYWTSPRSIIEKDIVPLMRKDPTYLSRNNIRLLMPRAMKWRPRPSTGMLKRPPI